MGGLHLSCGCFDGPDSPGNPQLVSVRCEEHLADGPLEGYKLVRRADLPAKGASSRLPGRSDKRRAARKRARRARRAARA